MKVKLLAHTPEPEKLVAAAAKNCYSFTDVDSVLDGLTEEKTQSFVHMLSEIGHESPIEHVSFTFAIEGVSRSLLAQITRHRMASFSVQSQRYVREHGFEYVVPPEIDKIPAAREQFIRAMEDDQRTYEALTAALMEGYVEELLAQGVPEKQARSQAEKHAIEDARYVLPNACATRIVMTANARHLKNFFKLRCWQPRAVGDPRACRGNGTAWYTRSRRRCSRTAGLRAWTAPAPRVKCPAGRRVQYAHIIKSCERQRDNKEKDIFYVTILRNHTEGQAGGRGLRRPLQLPSVRALLCRPVYVAQPLWHADLLPRRFFAGQDDAA